MMRERHSLDSKTLRAKLQARLDQAGPQRIEEAAQSAMSLPRLTFAQIRTGQPDRCLNPGQLLSLAPAEGDIELAATLKERAQQIRLQIPIPIAGLTFREHQQVRVRYWTKEEIYRFESQVLEISGVAQESLCISRPREGVVEQRRRSERVKLRVRFSFQITDARDSSLRGRFVLYAKTKDISLGGLAFETSLALALGDKLEAALKLAGSERPLKVAGRVVRCSPLEGSDKPINLVAVQFFQLPPEEHNRLLLFVAEHLPEEGGSEILWVG